MASNVITLTSRNTKQRDTQSTTKFCGDTSGAIIASFGQAKALRDLPRHLKAGAL